MPLSSVQEIANDILADQTCKRLYVVRNTTPAPFSTHMSCCACLSLPADGSSLRPRLQHTWLLLCFTVFWDLRLVLFFRMGIGISGCCQAVCPSLDKPRLHGTLWYVSQRVCTFACAIGKATAVMLSDARWVPLRCMPGLGAAAKCKLSWQPASPPSHSLSHIY